MYISESNFYLRSVRFTLQASSHLGAAHKLIGNALPISARVCKVKLAMNLVYIGKISCLCLLSKCFCAVFMVFRASIRQYIPDKLPNRLCRLLQISANHCRLVSVPPLSKLTRELISNTIVKKVPISLCQFPGANVAFHIGAYVNKLIKPFIHVALGKEDHSHSHLCPTNNSNKFVFVWGWEGVCMCVVWCVWGV